MCGGEIHMNSKGRIPHTNISNQPALLHFPCVKRAYVMSSTPCTSLQWCKKTTTTHCFFFGGGLFFCLFVFWSRCGDTIIICHPTLKSSHPKWHTSEWMPNEDKSSSWEQPPVWKELRPCFSECVKQAGRWRRDDTGLRAEEHRVVVKRMNTDWRSAQWQLNDLRSVDSVSINQTALSRSNFSLCLQPHAQGEGSLLSPPSLSPSISTLFVFCIRASPSLCRLLRSLARSLTAPSTGQFSFLLHLCISKRLKEWGHFALTLYHPCCSLCLGKGGKNIIQVLYNKFWERSRGHVGCSQVWKQTVTHADEGTNPGMATQRAQTCLLLENKRRQ